MHELPGGAFTLPGTALTVGRLGYGAMQLAGEGVYGSPKDEAGALAVLREAVKMGVNHIDTSDFYGPHVVNQIIKKALHPYPDELVLVTKVGATRGTDKSWNEAISKADLTAAVHDNLRNLGVEALDVVNFRTMPPGGGHGRSERSIAEPLSVLVDLQKEGLIKHIGLSNITVGQLVEGRKVAEIVCVQNMYNLAQREDNAMVDELARDGIAFVPFFPLGGFSPLQSETLNSVAAQLGQTPLQVALAWLLQRAPNVLLIPGTKSVEHLRENMAAAEIVLPADAVSELDGIAG